jgi:HAD superfamily hydrolase (TIGR01509 family)
MPALPLEGSPLRSSRVMASIGPFSFPADGFEAVVFDCDGTLVNSMPAHFEAWCEALAMYGAGGVFKEDVFFAMGGRPTLDIVVELNDEYDLHLDPAAVALAKREAFLKRLSSIELIDEVAAFAESLRGKVPLAIATGGSRMVIEKTLKAVGISDWFDEVVTADDVAEGKPAPDIFLRAARLLGVDAAKCLALEDAPAGILAAQRAGMQVIAIPTPLVCSSLKV